MNPDEQIIKGRGAIGNPGNRFEKVHSAYDPDVVQDEEAIRPTSQFIRDASKSIIAQNTSPDVGFEVSINPYRGCEHGCNYCYARPTHEYLGFSAGLDFETKIMVKHDAPQLLRAALMAKSYKPVGISISGVTDCYQPVERTLRITRGCLEVLAEFRNPVGLITKNHLITRDADVLAGLAQHDAAYAILSVTTLDADLGRVLEPRTSTPTRRLDAIAKLKGAGVPVGVMVAPIIPGLTDHETPAILKAAADAGASFAAYVPLRLPYVLAPMFEQWLGQHFPDRKDKVLNRIRSMRGGKLNDSNFHTRMTGEGVFADQIKTMFEVARRKAGLNDHGPQLSTSAFRRPPGPQLSLWE